MFCFSEFYFPVLNDYILYWKTTIDVWMSQCWGKGVQFSTAYIGRLKLVGINGKIRDAWWKKKQMIDFYRVRLFDSDFSGWNQREMSHSIGIKHNCLYNKWFDRKKHTFLYIHFFFVVFDVFSSGPINRLESTGNE